MTSRINQLVNAFIFALMIKYSIAIFLLVAFVAQTFSNGFVLIDYYTNTAAFAKNCVNKAKPKLHCNGKCQMMKKLQEEEKKDQQIPERKIGKKIEIICSFSDLFDFSSDLYFVARAINFEKSHPIQDLSYSFFHPPRA